MTRLSSNLSSILCLSLISCFTQLYVCHVYFGFRRFEETLRGTIPQYTIEYWIGLNKIKILYLQDIGIKWCSLDRTYAGKHARCGKPGNVLLRLYNSAEQPTSVVRQNCYQRQSSPYDSNILNDLATQINEILSCAHSGQADVRTAVIRPGTENELTYSEESCDFLSQRDALPHYGCFDDPNSRNLTACYGESGNRSFCLVDHTEVLMYGGVGTCD